MLKKRLTPKLFWPSLGLVFLTLFLYHRPLNAYFISDDYEWWRLVRDLNFFESLRLFLPSRWEGIVHPEFEYYRPLVAWTIWLNTVPLPMTPLVFHSTSLLFHLVNVFLVGFLGYMLFPSYLVAFMASLLFSVFPFHAEAVNYNVGGRFNVVMTMFYLLSILAVLFYQRSKAQVWIPLTSLMFFFGLASLESAITFPLVALLLLFVLKKQGWYKTLRQYRLLFVGLGLVVLLYFILRTLTLETFSHLTLPGYMSKLTLSRVFRAYLLGFLFLVSLRLCLKNTVSKIFGKKEKILWLLYALVGVFFLPTAYLPTQERHLYLPSTAAALFCSGFMVLFVSRVRKKLTYNLLIAVIILGVSASSFWLYARNEQWRLAGKYAQRITRELVDILKTLPSDEVIYLVNIPDSIKGAYVYRVREEEAVEFMMGEVPPKLVFTPKTIGTGSSVSVTGTRNLRVNSNEGFMFFNPETNETGQLVVKTPEYEATQLDKNSLEIKFLHHDFDIQESHVFLFKEGKLQPLTFRKEPT